MLYRTLMMALMPASGPEWLDYTDDGYWTNGGETWQAQWDGSGWVQGSASYNTDLFVIGTWADGFRPTEFRFLHDAVDNSGSSGTVTLRDVSSNTIASTSWTNYVSGTSIPCNFSSAGDIYRFYFSPSGDNVTRITGIQFLGEPPPASEWIDITSEFGTAPFISSQTFEAFYRLNIASAVIYAGDQVRLTITRTSTVNMDFGLSWVGVGSDGSFSILDTATNLYVIDTTGLASGGDYIDYIDVSTTQAMEFQITKVERREAPSYVSIYPPAYNDTYVKATTVRTTHYAHDSVDPNNSLIDSALGNQWLGDTGNNKFNIDLGSAEIVERLYAENSHESGSFDLDAAVKICTIYGTNEQTAFDNTTSTNVDDLTELAEFEIAQHTGGNNPDPQYFPFDNSTAYRYYVMIFTQWSAGYYGIRRLELQIEG